MKALLQRVIQASVVIEAHTVARIENGCLALIGIEPDDTPVQARRLIDRILGYRMFPDEAGRMNLDLKKTDGGLLLVSQFTLVADTRKGTRPGFSTAAAPTIAEPLFDILVDYAKTQHPDIETGQFGADMQVSLVNDGPVTFWLST